MNIALVADEKPVPRTSSAIQADKQEQMRSMSARLFGFSKAPHIQRGLA